MTETIVFATPFQAGMGMGTRERVVAEEMEEGEGKERCAMREGEVGLCQVGTVRYCMLVLSVDICTHKHGRRRW